MSQQLRYFLILLCSGPPLRIIQSADTQNGFELWRLLNRRYTVEPLVRQHGAPGRILESSLSEIHFPDATARLEAELPNWERDAGKTLPGTLAPLEGGRSRWHRTGHTSYKKHVTNYGNGVPYHGNSNRSTYAKDTDHQHVSSTCRAWSSRTGHNNSHPHRDVYTATETTVLTTM